MLSPKTAHSQCS
uniref:Uncharacterized protein n=1 Tax=Anguilla anguilla TaxID=7936 RepID=A0A0E9XM65_ANGAN